MEGLARTLIYGVMTFSLVPRPPFNTARGKGGLVNIVQHFCTSTEFRAVQSDWLMVATVLGFLTANHLAILITPLQTYLAHVQFTEAQQEAWRNP